MTAADPGTFPGRYEDAGAWVGALPTLPVAGDPLVPAATVLAEPGGSVGSLVELTVVRPVEDPDPAVDPAPELGVLPLDELAEGDEVG